MQQRNIYLLRISCYLVSRTEFKANSDEFLFNLRFWANAYSFWILLLGRNHHVTIITRYFPVEGNFPKCRRKPIFCGEKLLVKWHHANYEDTLLRKVNPKLMECDCE